MRRAHFTTILAALVLGLAGAATASGAETITLQVLQIRATGDPSSGAREIDPWLEPLAKQLRRYPYRRFRRMTMSTFSLNPGGQATQKLFERGFTLYLEPGAPDSKGFIPVAVSIRDARDKQILAVQLRLKNGATSLVVKELESGEGAMILAVTARRR